MTRYVRVGGYPNTDPYYRTPEQQERDDEWDSIPENPDGEEDEGARVLRMRAEMKRKMEKSNGK